MTCDRSVVFSGTPDSSTNKTDSHDIIEILLKVTLCTIKPTKLTQILLGFYSGSKEPSIPTYGCGQSHLKVTGIWHVHDLGINCNSING